MFDAKTLADALERAGGQRPNQARAAAILAQIDQAAIEAEEDGRFILRIWDQQSPLNGRDPEFIRARLRETHGWDGQSAVYLHVDPVTGHAHRIQPHRPGSPGHQMMQPDEAATVGEEERRAHASERAAARIVGQARALLTRGA